MKPLAIALALLFQAFAGQAAAAGPARTAHLTAELVSQTAGVAPGSTAWVAVVLTHDKGWHTYWRNPGDAGEPTTIRWSLPAGWRAGDIVWPAPRRLPLGPLMNYGYEGRTLLAAPIEVPASARAGAAATIAAEVDFLVCAEVCVPGTANLSLVLPVVAGAPVMDPKWGAALTDALAAAPKDAGLIARFTRAGPVLKLAVAGMALKGVTGRDAGFFPFDDKLIDQAKPQGIERGPQGLTFTLVPGVAFAGGGVPREAAGVIETDGKAFEADASPGPLPAGAAGFGAPARGATGNLGLALAALFAFAGGVILNLMPCVFPILAMKAAALARHREDVAAAQRGALAFAAGVMATFLALAGLLVAARAGGAAVGWGFQLQSPRIVAVLALVMFAAGLDLSGVFEIGTSLQGLGSGAAARGDLLGAAATGALAVIVAAPCTAPFMGPALGWALTQSTATALAVFAALGAGFAAPFAILAVSPPLVARLPRPGPWMATVRSALAFGLYGAAAWLTWVLAQQLEAGVARLFAAALLVAAAAQIFGAAQRRAAGGRRSAVPIALAGIAVAGSLALILTGPFAGPARAAVRARASGPSPTVYSPARLAALRDEGRPVLVNFTAAWCVTCQVNERLALSSPLVAAALQRTDGAYLVADWTRRDPAIAAELAAQGRIGVPLYLVYGAGGGAAVVLPQLLTPAMVAAALDRAALRPPASAAR